jgi:hypothetical protein
MTFLKNINHSVLPKRGRIFLVTILFRSTRCRTKTVIIRVNAIAPDIAQKKAIKIIEGWDFYYSAETLQIEDRFTHEIFKLNF